MSDAWTGGQDGEEWCVTVDHDCFEDGKPFVVALWVESADGGPSQRTLAELSPSEAREVAAELFVQAREVERANQRLGMGTDG